MKCELSKGHVIPGCNFDTSTLDLIDLDLKLAVEKLPSTDREILKLHLMGHTHQEIAKLFSVERSTISKRLRRILETLSSMLKE